MEPETAAPEPSEPPAAAPAESAPAAAPAAAPAESAPAAAPAPRRKRAKPAKAAVPGPAPSGDPEPPEPPEPKRKKKAPVPCVPPRITIDREFWAGMVAAQRASAREAKQNRFAGLRIFG